MTATIDIQITRSGNIFLVQPVTQEAKDWIEKNVQTEDWQWFGTALCVDQHYIESLLRGMQDDGLVIV